MGHEVIISSYWGLSGAPTQWNGITVLPGYGSNYCSTSLGQHCKAVNPDLVITLGDIWVLDPNILRSIPVAHWLPVDCRPQSAADRSVIDQTGAQLIAMSRWGQDRMKTAGYNPLYVPHGIDTQVFTPPQSKQELRKACFPDGAFVVGINAANNDAIRKALPEQMLAFAKFHSRYPDSILALHTGVHQDGGQDLEALAENIGITDLVRVVDQYRLTGGLVSPADLAEWYGILDVVSACSYGEGFGLPILEAQSCGTPVICTEASAMAELNPHGIRVSGDPFWNGVHKGWWIRPSLGQMADAYEWHYLHRDEIDREKLREFTVANYDVDYVAKTYMGPAIEEMARRMKAKA